MTDTVPSGQKEASSTVSNAAAWYGVSVLLIAYTLSFVDRTIMVMLIGPMKEDLVLTDTEVSLLIGIAFVGFYTLMGLPIGRLADQFSRRWIITLGVIFWSFMTAACGLARSFWTLFAARMGVGVGEAALSPSAYSLIADYFEPAKLGRALGVYSAGVYIGAGLAFIIGGFVIEAVSSAPSTVLPLIGEMASWQIVFLVVGLPGVLVGLLVLTIKEPVRRGLSGPLAAASKGAEQRPRASFKKTLGYMVTHWKTYGAHILGFSFLGLTFNAVLAWSPTMFIRKFEWGLADAGLALGLAMMICGSTGIIAGGWVADRLTRNGHRDATMSVGVISAVGVVPFVLLATLVPNAIVSALMFGAYLFFASFAYGAAAAALQLVSPNEMRAQISAIYLFVLNVLGLALGPTLTAIVTDYVFGRESAVDWSIALVGAAAGIIGGIILYAGRPAFRRSMHSLDAQYQGA